jgi:hypothetical protein
MAFKIGNSEVAYEQNVDRYSNNNNIYLGDSAIPKTADTVVQKAFNTAGKVIESSGDILSAPAVWLKDMQKNWFGYMTLIAITLSAIVFIYLAFRFHWRRKTNGVSTSHLVELATAIVNKNGAGQRLSSSTTSNQLVSTPISTINERF